MDALFQAVILFVYGSTSASNLKISPVSFATTFSCTLSWSINYKIFLSFLLLSNAIPIQFSGILTPRVPSSLW